MKKTFAALVLPLTLVSCATRGPRAPVSLEAIPEGTYALFSFSIEGIADGRLTECKLVLTQKAPQQKHIYILPEGDTALMKIPAGTYRYEHIDCGFERRYLVSNPFGKKQNEFSLLPGKINYLGHTTLSFDSKDDLKLRYDQKDHLAAIQRIFSTLTPQSWAANHTVSAYTQRSIRREITTFDLPRAYSVKSQAPKEEQIQLKAMLGAVQAKIGKCAEVEALSNPLKIGALQVSYTHKNGKLVAGERRDTHVYSNAFIACVQKSMSEITYSADYAVSIDMKL